MFTPKANSKQRHTHGRDVHTHGRATQTTRDFRFLRLSHFERKIQTVNPFSMPLPPMRSLHLALSHSIENTCFSHPKTTFPKSLIITYLSKSLILDFHEKP